MESSQEGSYKLKNNVAIIDKQHGGLGGTIRSYVGDPIVSFFDWSADIGDIANPKALELRKGLEITRDVGIQSLLHSQTIWR